MPKAMRRPLAAMLQPDTLSDDDLIRGAFVVVCDDGAVFSYSWMEDEWREVAPVPGSRRAPIKAREDAKDRATAEKTIKEGLNTFMKRTATKERPQARS